MSLPVPLANQGVLRVAHGLHHVVLLLEVWFAFYCLVFRLGYNVWFGFACTCMVHVCGLAFLCQSSIVCGLRVIVCCKSKSHHTFVFVFCNLGRTNVQIELNILNMLRVRT